MLATALLAAWQLSPALAAQTTPPAAPNEAAETITLPVFNVTGRNDGTYTATDTTSATRISQKIINLPFSVQVLTSEFIDDFQLYDLDDQVPFVSNFVSGDKNQGGGGGTTARGFIVPYFRNGFYRRQAPDSNSIDRVEVVEGPASAIFGRTSPGGVINYISKKPQPRAQAGASYMVGTYDTQRTDAFATGPLFSDKFFYRLDLAYYDMKRPTDFWYNRTFNLSGSFTYKFTPDTTLNFEFEHTDRVMNDFGNATRWVDAAGVTQGLVSSIPDPALATRLLKFNQAGKNRRTDRGNDSYYLTFEHRFGDQLSMRAAGGYSKRSFERLGPTVPGNWNLVATSSTPRNWRGTRTMSEQTIDDWQIGSQIDFTYLFKTGAVDQRTLFTFDAFEDDTKQKTWTLSGAALNAALTAILPTGTPLTAWTQPNIYNLDLLASLPDPAFNPGTYPEQDSGTFNLYRSYAGGLLSHTVSLLDNRLVLFGALRDDFATFKRQQPLSTKVNLKEATSDLTKTTFSTGINYHIVGDQLVGYVGYGSSFNPSPTVDANTGEILGNTTARGGEAGFKGVLFGQRISYGRSVFRTREKNEATSNPDNPGGADLTKPALVPGGESETRGASVYLSGKLSANLTLLGNLGWTDTRIVRNVSAPTLVGQRLTGGQGGPVRTSAAALRYAFSQGKLKGLRLGLTYQYYPSYIRFYGTANATTGAITAVNVSMPGLSQWGAMAAYSHQPFGKTTVTYMLNVTDLFDQRVLTPGFFYPPGTEAKFTTSFRF